MQDAQHLERVKLEFFMFEIPKGVAKAEYVFYHILFFLYILILYAIYYINNS